MYVIHVWEGVVAGELYALLNSRVSPLDWIKKAEHITLPVLPDL